MNGSRPEHPALDLDELRRQRGEDPPEVVGRPPEHPDGPDPKKDFVPDPGRAEEWRKLASTIAKEHRPHREDVYPYLLVRAFSPGDRGQRPIWPPTPCWESPDLLLIDASYTGPFDPGRLVVSPAAGRAYRVFVRVWNLGLFPGVGVHVQAWAVATGFFGAANTDDPYYQQHHLGGAWVDLKDRRDPGCVAIVELDRRWRVDPELIGHSCMLASVSCPADHFTGALLVNKYRHVGQRNLTVLGPEEDAQPLIALLAGRVLPRGFTLELTHGGPAARPLLMAVGGREATVPELGEIQGGVDIGASAHLLTAFEFDGNTVVVPSQRLARLVGLEPAKVHPFAQPGGTRMLLEHLGPNVWRDIGQVIDAPLTHALVPGLMNALGIDDLRTATLAKRFGGPEDAQHLLRFTLTSPQGELVGGYSIVVGRLPV
ncbi:hypothetical protein [Kitasatospora sp. NPDC056184]|uniref:hypothetical protein n=1 Tax=Kitasatospora sp. NPDC056184 TaxID=3345738 RepID=UPI0035D6AD63